MGRTVEPTPFSVILQGRQGELLRNCYLWSFHQVPRKGTRSGMRTIELKVKRVFDVMASFAALLILSPFLLFTAVLIRVTSPGPAIFRHERLGKDGVAFTVFKFRTMYQGSTAVTKRTADGATIVHKQDPRVTPIGSILRKWSIDELPQLWNVLRGEMSLVGPRPDETLAMALYTPRERVKLGLKPGLTGLATVNGRNSVPWRTRIEWDVRYVKEFSLKLDLLILLRTVKVVVKREGIYTQSADSSTQSDSGL